jgi:calcineurin-like phosphoesterase family protein
MKRFITSNLQLGRPNAIKKYKRPFKDVDEMTRSLIKEWNSVVSDGDLVYSLGNFAWDPKTAQDALEQLNGQIWLIPAEYDEAVKTLAEKRMLRKGVRMINRIMPLKLYKATLSYWPLETWPGKQAGYYSVIGHPQKQFKSNPEKKRINASTDFWSYRPQDLDRTLDLFRDI